MAKVELIGGMKCVKGWDKVVELVEKNMTKSPGLEKWTVKIRGMTGKEAWESDKEFIPDDMDKKKKILTIAFAMKPTTHPEDQKSMIMGELLGELEEKDRI